MIRSGWKLTKTNGAVEVFAVDERIRVAPAAPKHSRSPDVRPPSVHALVVAQPWHKKGAFAGLALVEFGCAEDAQVFGVGAIDFETATRRWVSVFRFEKLPLLEQMAWAAL